ncbi:reverse transcriptase [compost metagenome]
MKAVKKHTDCDWVILYINRWLKAPFQRKDGSREERTAGTPQGGVISPVLANLFLHYTFDKWMEINHCHNPWARYADDAVIHCRTKEEAQVLLAELTSRFHECKLSLHPQKTKIVYCKDSNRTQEYPNISFDFLGYTFRPRQSINKQGEVFTNFTPAVSNKAKKAMRQTVRQWRIHRMTAVEIEDIARMFDPIIRGWMNYYGRFYKTELNNVLQHINKIIALWSRNKYKKMAKSKTRAIRWLRNLAINRKELFTHWKSGATPTIG